MKTFRSYSSAETIELGGRLAQKIRAGKSGNKKFAVNGATILALQGDLGAGKTTFTQGFARGLGIMHRIASPTFVIMRRFPLSSSFKNLYHIDAYRLKKLDSLDSFGLEAIFSDPKNIVLIEWPEKIKKALSREKKTIWLKFRYGKKESERIIQSSVSLSL